MKYVLLLVAACFSGVFSAGAQSLAGVTGVRDTSYTNYSAYQGVRKTHPNATLVPERTERGVAEAREQVYCTVGSRQLVLDVFYPKRNSKQQRPAVMIIHGGGWRSGNRSQHYPLAQRLASLGYVCFTPEYRLSTEALFPAAVHDLKAALQWTKQQAASYGADSGKLGVVGFSAGGELAAFLGATSGVSRFDSPACDRGISTKVGAVVDLDGTLSFVHPESGEGDDSKRTSAATYWFGYPKAENIALWTDASPLTHAGMNTPPTLFINSSVDRMHAGREDYISILKQHGIDTEVRSFPDAPHSFPLLQPWFDPMVGYIDGFLKKVFRIKGRL